jgi:ubiquinone biosynthesis protein
MAKLLGLLFEVTEIFDMQTRPELVLLQKTMVVVEGVARTLDPKLDVWTTSEPVVGAWIAENLGPAGNLHDAGRAASTLARFAANLPSALLRGENIVNQLEGMAENGFELSEAAIAKIGEAEARGARFGHIALWLLVVIGLIMLLR